MVNIDELLKYAVDTGIIDLSRVQEEIAMQKRKDVLNKHKYSIWFSEEEKVWYTYLPDEERGRKRVRRKNKKDLMDLLIKYYGMTKDIKTMTVKELFYDFMEHKKLLVKSGTVRRMMADWNKYYEPNTEFVNKPFRELTKIDIDDFFNAILLKHNLNKKAFYNMCGVLKQALEYAVDAEYTDKNPYRTKINKKLLKKTRKKSSTMEVYQSNEKDLILAEMERRIENNPYNTAPLAVMLDFELGTRKGEILAICESDISNGKIHICKQVVEEFDTTDVDNIRSLGFQVAEYTKSDDGDRWLPLSTRAMEIIERIRQVNKENNEKYQDYLFVRDGYVMSPDTIDAQIKRGCEHIGIPVKTMHKIRKTYASTLLNNGVNLSIVKDMLGHADESTTLKHYIFNTMNEDDTSSVVLAALEGKSAEKEVIHNKMELSTLENELSTGSKRTKQDQKIISFNTCKKARNPVKSTVLASK